MASDDELIDRLPDAYATAIRLHRDHVSDERIADSLGMDVESVPGLLLLAEAKLAALAHGPWR